MGSGDINRVRGIFNLPADEQFIGGKLWGKAPVRCECTRKGGAVLWLFRHYIGLEYEDNIAPDCFHVGEVHLEPSWKVYIQKNSFSIPPLCLAEIRIVPVDNGVPPSTLLLKDEERGWEASKAIQFMWQAVNNELSERSHVHLACNRFVDVVGVVAKLPVEERSCTLVTQQGEKLQGKLMLNGDGVLGFTSYSRGGDKSWLLDNIIMIRKGKKSGLSDTLEFLEIKSASETSRWVVANLQDFTKTYEDLTRTWCLNCNSIVNYRLMNHITEDFCPSPHIKKRHSAFVRKNHAGLEDKVCFSVDEVCSLLKAYQMMDEDQSGLISKQEWINSLGPVFRQSQTARAVFSCFDSNNDGLISFSEFLFGCRVLHLGTPRDRLQYQYRVFDPSGTGRISLAQFITVAHSLHEAVGCVVPPSGCSGIEEYATRLFHSMAKSPEGDVDVEAFRETIQQDEVFSRAFQGLAELRKHRVSESKIRTGKPVWFGDPQWLQCTAILQGINLSIDNRVDIARTRGPAPTTSEAFTAAFHEKQTWELGSQRALLNDAKLEKKPHPHYEGTRAGKAAHPLVAYESYFTDYSPQVFMAIQERFGVTSDEYKASLGIDQLHSSLLVGCLSNLASVASSGRSGAFFYASHDGAFILKTIDKEEGKVLRNFLPAYYDHIMAYPETLLTRYFGLHALCYGGTKMYFLVMNNVMQPPARFPIHIRYDLKGSTVGRTTPSDRRKDDVALKDLDFKRKLVIEQDMRKRFIAQVRADSDLLQRSNLNDYSLLIGIHTCDESIPPPPVRAGDRLTPFWLQFYGGIPSKDRREIYYIGIIDLLTEFGFKKKGEYTLKSLYYRKGKVSCVPPEEYRERFVQFAEYIFPCAVPAWGTPHRSLSPPAPHNLRFNPVQTVSPAPFHNFAETPDVIASSPPGSPVGLM